MSFTNIGLQNFFQHDFNALSFSLMGMGLVFGGLLVIALYIAMLPKLLELSHRRQPQPEPAEAQPSDKRQEEEILLAIATAFHLHTDFPEGSERITWKSHGDMESPWLVSGRMHSLTSRKLPNTWRR